MVLCKLASSAAIHRGLSLPTARTLSPTARSCASSPTPRPRRSALYLPASNARHLEKARGLAADVLLLDCEDAVAPESKPLARAQAAAALADRRFGAKEVVVRVNSLSSAWGKADALAVAPHADAVLLPKVEAPEQVARLAALLARACAGVRDAPPRVWCMIETPLGVCRAESLAAMAAVDCLVAGTSDLAAELRCDGAWDERAALLPSLSLIVLGARAHGKAVLDGVHLDIRDQSGFVRSCKQGRAMGFDGKTLISPATIADANAAFSPSEAEVAHARRVVAAFAQAAEAGAALAVLDGRLVEELHVREARRLLALAHAVQAAG
ncbi:hypothetical protein AB1Y20_001778 [Prymnesium parvum]|uniref:HpcH/HpaI aldolase/citrate lyase domain-containing protein n=1 Tax=Prymnesium parvum TaxID=97485 RepID=A0AB34K995_PRYPA